MTLERWIKTEKAIEEEITKTYNKLLIALTNANTEEDKQRILRYADYRKFIVIMEPKELSEVKLSKSVSDIETKTKEILEKHPYLNIEDIKIEHHLSPGLNYFYLYYYKIRPINKDELQNIIVSEQSNAFGYHSIQITIDMFKQYHNNPLIKQYLDKEDI